MVLHSYKELLVWQKSMELVVSVYELTEQLPRTELFGLTSQIRRAAVSIPANIAEGRFRGTRKDFAQFLRIAYSSGAELETHIEITKRLPFGKKLRYTQVDSSLSEVMKMLNAMLSKLSVS
jgi:four helix bundle protein